MKQLLTNRISSITEWREPGKVIEKAGDQPVAILKNNECLGYFVPARTVSITKSSFVKKDTLLAALKATEAEAQPVLDYLKDK